MDAVQAGTGSQANVFRKLRRTLVQIPVIEAPTGA